MTAGPTGPDGVFGPDGVLGQRGHEGVVDLHQVVRVGAPTERRNPHSTDLDLMSTRDVLTVINDADRRVPAAVAAVLDEIAATVDLAVTALRGGHRVHYFGAGTSGRLGVIDAAELAPTFNSPDGWFCAHLAGGPDAMWRAVEDAEDDLRGARPRPPGASPQATWWSDWRPAGAHRTSSGRSTRPGSGVRRRCCSAPIRRSGRQPGSTWSSGSTPARRW